MVRKAALVFVAGIAILLSIIVYMLIGFKDGVQEYTKFTSDIAEVCNFSKDVKLEDKLKYVGPEQRGDLTVIVFTCEE